MLDLALGLTQVLSDGNNDYLYGMGRIGQVDASGDALYHLAEVLGSVRQLANDTGALVNSTEYSPFGVSDGMPETLSIISGNALEGVGCSGRVQ